MEKKNTIVLTVIAIATLLVAVVGATFAYFAVTNDVSNGKVTTTVTTVSKADSFTATGSGDMTIELNNDNMSNNKITYDTDGNAIPYTITSSSDSGKIVVSLTAGSGTATCTYDLQLVQSTAEGITEYTKTTGVTDKEFTIQGTDDSKPTAQTVAEIEIPAALASTITAGESDETGTQATGGILGNYTISDSGSDTTATVQNWAFTTTFYNLNANQNDFIGKTLGYTVKVVNVKCTNSNS